jgi:hypothetical protein
MIAVVVALSGCASLRPEKPPVCDGKHRRPANPYGSVLNPAAPPVAPAPAATAEPDKLSAIAPAYGSCGA